MMPKEYIEREALYSEIIPHYKSANAFGSSRNVCKTWGKVLDMVQNAPAADVVERKHGEWIEHDCFVCDSDGRPVDKIGSVFVCSECGREERYKEPFCHCGADMRE